MSTATATTTAISTAQPVACSATAAGDDLPLRFGSFCITETQAFPPPPAAQCWAYLTLNAEIALSLPGNPALQQLIQSPRARISVDGQWLWWGLRRKYRQRPLHKLSGSDLIHRIAAHCATAGQRLLLLGSTPRANAAAVLLMRQRWPGLDVAGYAPAHCAADAGSEQAMHEQAFAAIRAHQPHHVVLGFGAAKEQRFALQMAARLDGSVIGLYCFGGAIDLAGGAVRRAPRLWQRLGLEGLYRVLQQPSRLGRLLKVLRILPVLAQRRY